mgnify:FL=1
MAYDGGAFDGWQRQPGRRTVQGVLEAALYEITGEAARVVGAGRTDTGVHATGQVVHVDIDWTDTPRALRRAWNAVLARDVAVRSLGVAPDGFHARHSATSRRYRYVVWCHPVRHPLLRRTSLHVAAPMDVDAMADAAARLVGSRDFAAFGRPVGHSPITVRRLDRLEVFACGSRIEVRLEGNAFLRHQVRRTVGLLIDVGRGRWRPGVVDDVLAGVPGAPVAWRAPAWGLTLTGVSYPDEDVIRTGARSRAPEEGERT